MSWDIWLEADCGGADNARIEGADWSYTYNTNPMLQKAGIDIKKWPGKRARDVIVELGVGIQVMESNSISMRDLNPRNGWGDFDSLLEVLKEIQKYFIQYPTAYIGAWF